MRTIDVTFHATPQQEKAFQYLVDRGIEGGLESVTGVTQAHELTKEHLQAYLDQLVEDESHDDSFVHGFDYGFDFGVAMTLIGGME